MIFPKDFLSLQIEFANKVRELENIPLDKALFEYTSLPVRFGISFSSLSEDNLVWQEFISRLSKSDDLLETAYKFHLEMMEDAPAMRYQFGCFSYDALENERGVRIHFANNDTPEPGVLSAERVPMRMKELKNMFEEIKNKYPDFTFVISSSWLFNVNAFKRLFPASFTANLIPKKNDYHSLGVWGQFIDKRGEVKQSEKEVFLKKVDEARSKQDLENAFSLKDFKVEANISDFYSFYKVE